MILHCDLDAFYASVEQVLDPSLVGKPVIVGGDPRRRGVVAAASYEARKFGVHSAMPLSKAVRLCPHGVYVPPRFDVYRDYSGQVFEVFHQHTPLVEPLSLDEAFLDLSGTERIQGSAREVALAIRDEVKTRTRLNISIGIATSKLVAKIASDLEKPCGLVEVPPGSEADFLAPLAIRRIPGLGPSTEARLESLRLKTIADLAAAPIEELRRRLGSYGGQLWEFAHGIDRRAVTPPGDPKSISRETTFDQDIDDLNVLEATLRQLTQKAARNLRDNGLCSRTVQLKLRYSNFETLTRSHSLPSGTDIDDTLFREVLQLFRQAYDPTRKIRLIGAGLSSLEEPSNQLSLFGEAPTREARLTASLDRIRDKHGFGAISIGTPARLEQRDWRKEDLDVLGRRSTRKGEAGKPPREGG